jgi:hypothetical protein
MIEEIKLGKHITIYRTNFKDIDNIQLSKELWYSTELFKMTRRPSEIEPGIQSEILVNSESVNLVRNKMIESMFSLFNKPFFYSINEWIFISKNDNIYSGFHTHLNAVATMKCKQKPDYTLTYYSKMPDNLEGDDGCIIFKDIDENEFPILPKEGDLIIFGTEILHRAATNTKSINERIVFCTNFTFLDINKSYNKKEKTLL